MHEKNQGARMKFKRFLMVLAGLLCLSFMSCGQLSLRQRAELGDAVAQITLGMNYAAGEGVPQDYKKAVKWYLRAARQKGRGNSRECAQLLLGHHTFDL